jgi:UDP-N-acetylglucosamine diphosphorylase/glucosamine-1-phosphate N-acetyltransferase
MQLCIFEDDQFVNFLPLAHLRPVYALRCGATKLRQKIERLFPRSSIAYACRPYLASYLRHLHPDTLVNELSDEPTWFVNGRVLPNSAFQRMVKSFRGVSRLFAQNGTPVAAFVESKALGDIKRRLTEGVVTPETFRDIPSEESDSLLLDYPWGIIHRNAEELKSDFSLLSGKRRSVQGKVHPGVHLVNKRDIVVGPGSVLKPGAVLDAENGPIIIGKNVLVYPNAVIEGPVFIGDGSTVKAGAKIYGGTSIGEVCKVGGEVEASVIHSFANKQHDGFLGHSYLGSWVNVGADSNTSDLKNNYGTVEIELGERRINTGMQFVGLFMGDHSKTGINAMFDTGTIVGISCNLFGSGLPPKFVPSFSWGNTSSSMFSVYRLEKSIETAKRVLARRGVEWSLEYEKLLSHVFTETVSERSRVRIF